MADLKNVQPLNDFDWDAFEKGTFNEDKIEVISEYKQGVAIVKKNNLFGAIMVGGKEIIKPIYEKLSDFDCGYAKASYTIHINGVEKQEERSINMSGQICVMHNENEVYLPEEYDWGMDFDGNLCVVIKNGLYGVIDSNFNTILDCSYTHFDSYINGYATFEGTEKTVMIDTEGRICYCLENIYTDGYKIISSLTDGKFYGLLNEKNNLVLPVKYDNLNRLKCGLLVSKTDNQQYSFINPLDGLIKKTIECDDVYDISSVFFAIKANIGATKNSTLFYDKEFCELETIPYCIDNIRQNKESVLFKVNGLSIECTCEGNLFVLPQFTNGWSQVPICVSRKSIRLDYLKCRHEYLAKGYEKIIDENNKVGIADIEGNIIISPKYDYINFACKDLFVAAIPNQEDNNHLVFGVIDNFDNIKIPFKYGFLLYVVGEVFAFTMDEKYPVNNYNIDKYYHAMLLSKDESYIKDISYGIVTIKNGELTKSNIKKIRFTENNDKWLIVGILSMGKHETYPDLKYGVLGIDGNYLIYPWYSLITFDKDINRFSVSLNRNNPYASKQIIDEKGNLITHDVNGSILLVPSHIAQTCGSFSDDGIAEIVKDGIIGHINRKFEIVSFFNDHYIEIPKQYDFALNFVYGYASVIKNDKYGIIDSNCKEVIPCKYDEIEAISPNYLKFQENNQWGIMDFLLNIIIEPLYANVASCIEEKFVVSLASTKQNGSSTQHSHNYGVIDSHGTILIPHKYHEIEPISHEGNILWIVTSSVGYSQYKKGAFDNRQELVIPIIFDDIVVNDDKLECNVFEKSYNACKTVQYSAKYNFVGQQILLIDKGRKVRVPKEYMLAYSSGLSMLRVMKNEKWGLIHIDNSILVEPQYTYIDKFQYSYAIIGNSDEGCIYSFDDFWHIPNMKYGLIDNMGEIVLPIEYKDISFWDNGYICVYKDGEGYSLLSPTLHQLISGYSLCEKLDNRFIIVDGESNNYCSMKRLIDYLGHEVFDNSKINTDFKEIEIIEDTYFKITFSRGDYGSHIGIANFAGKIIYDNWECNDIVYLRNGYFKVEKLEFIDYDNVLKTYNLVNSVGNEVFEKYYYNIDIKDDTTIFITGRYGNGMADIYGNIIIPPRYANKLKFNNGFSNIYIKGDDKPHIIDRQNNVIVINKNNSKIILPKKYHWGTNFLNGLSIVREFKGYRDFLGVIKEDGTTVLEAKYDNISFLSNNTIFVKEKDCYGLFASDGKCILPTIFTSIDFVGKDRLRVLWNLIFSNDWQGTDKPYTVTEDKFAKQNDLNYTVKNRSAICNYEGKILNDVSLPCIGKFIGKYAITCRTIEFENNKIKLKGIGVIDINGNSILSNDYDYIKLFNTQYARVTKGHIRGIANLEDKSVKFFDNLTIKHAWEIDVYGRMVYTENGKYISSDDDWNSNSKGEYDGNRGVVSNEGILVPHGIYDSIILLENGLIKVANKDNTLYGLLDKNGKEILPVKYTSISSFIRDQAIVSLGGELEGWQRKIRNAKWGIINSNGEFIQECTLDEKPEIKYTYEDSNDDEHVVDAGQLKDILSDYIPQKEPSYYEYYSCGYYDDDGRYSKYGEYNGYDDQTIGEAFEGDPSLTWNID